MPTKSRASSRPRAPIVESPALPHERDESPEVSGTRRGVIKQAAKDLAAGLVDTDNYTRAREITQPALSRKGRTR